MILDAKLREPIKIQIADAFKHTSASKTHPKTLTVLLLSDTGLESKISGIEIRIAPPHG